MRLKDKVAVITGGASGIGLATTFQFLEEGASVVIADFNEAAGEAAVGEAANRGFADKISFIRTDVSKEDDVIAMFRHAVDTFGKLDIAFNNAGIGGTPAPVTEITVEDWDSTFNVLAKGVLLGIKHAARIMKEQGSGGSIINTASIAAFSGDCAPAVYSAAKAAVINLVKTAAIQLGGDRIRVNAICPGLIATPMSTVDNEEAVKEMLNKAQPWPDYGRAEYIAGAAVFLASGDAEFVTGESLVVDGGLHAAGPQLSRIMAPEV